MSIMTGGELRNRASRTGKLSRAEQRQLQRELATRDLTRSQLARQFGVSTSYVSQFAKSYAREIDAIRARLDDEFAGLWIADKAQRLAAYQDEFDTSLNHLRHDHFEQIRTRTQILHIVAEELGQLPPRTTIAVVPVVHIIENVNLELLK